MFCWAALSPGEVLAGHITATFGKWSVCSTHQTRASFSVLHLTCGRARYAGLFGIFAHGITETWVVEKKLIGLVACESERHTAESEHQEVWTTEALESIGITAAGVLGQ